MDIKRFINLDNLAIVIPLFLVCLQIVEYFSKPYVFYTTIEIDTYPVIWTADEEFNLGVPISIHREVAKHVAKLTAVGVRNTGSRTAKDLLIRFPRKDDYRGWIIRQGVEGQEELDFHRPTIKLDELVPGESVTMLVYSPSSDESVSDEIEVWYDGGMAELHPSRPVPEYVGFIYENGLAIYLKLFFFASIVWSVMYWYQRIKLGSANK